MGERYVEGTSFSVQDYKKPEYAVKVTAQTPRVLQGQPIKATIDARYYFGEPVANAKVKWVVHTSPYYPIGTIRSEGGTRATQVEGQGDEGDDTTAANRRARKAARWTPTASYRSPFRRSVNHQEAGPDLSH